MVSLGKPLNRTTEDGIKLVPLTVKVKLDPPIAAEEGLMLVMLGIGLFPAFKTVNTWALEVPPPGPGFTTFTLNDPVEETSEAGIDESNWLEETNVVDLAEPLKFTTEDGVKLEPFTAKVKLELPTTADCGDMLVVDGTALKTTKTMALDVPPPGPGFTTVMLNDPVEEISEAGIEAVN